MITYTSKLPNVGTTIFTTVSAAAQEHGAINLAQGFPDFDANPSLLDLVAKYLYDQKNQYAPMPGVLKLRVAIAAKLLLTQGTYRDPSSEVTITAGATQALFTAIAAFVHHGDEVIVIEPAYDSYVPSIETQGGIPIYLTTLPPDFVIDWTELEAKINPKTKMIIINTPGNPSTKTWKKEDYDRLTRLVDGTDIIVLSDEVYEHLTYDGETHLSIQAIDGLRDRSISVYSFGKTYHTTGWKIGYAIAPKTLMDEIRKVHQYNVFCVSSFVQYALAEYLEKHESWRLLPLFYQTKRDLLSDLMQDTKLKEVKSEGSFFSLWDYSAISTMKDMEWIQHLIQDCKVAAIPLSVFYHEAIDVRYMRLCFAKKEETLYEASSLLRKKLS